MKIIKCYNKKFNYNLIIKQFGIIFHLRKEQLYFHKNARAINAIENAPVTLRFTTYLKNKFKVSQCDLLSNFR